MIHIRPLASAVLMTLLLTSVTYADRVEVIVPGGNSGMLPTVGTEPADTGIGTLSRGSAGSATVYSPAEVDTRPGLQTMHFGGASLACKVASSSKDLVVINQGLEPLPAGTRIKWQLKNEGKRGFFAIVGELGGGQSLVADDVLDGAAGTDDVCVARVI